jgi:hypothetical protein
MQQLPNLARETQLVADAVRIVMEKPGEESKQKKWVRYIKVTKGKLCSLELIRKMGISGRLFKAGLLILLVIAVYLLWCLVSIFSKTTDAPPSNVTR